MTSKFDEALKLIVDELYSHRRGIPDPKVVEALVYMYRIDQIIQKAGRHKPRRQK